MIQVRKELFQKPIASYFEEISRIDRFTENFRIKLISSAYDYEQVISKSSLSNSTLDITDSTFVQTLSFLYKSGNRDANLGNSLAIKLLERSIEKPIEFINSETTFKNKFYFELFLKSFKERLINEDSFEVLKTLGFLIRNKENFSFFLNNHGFEFFYQLILDNPVFLDDLGPAKSIAIVIDTILCFGKQEDIRYLVTLFFSSEIQNRIDFFANFLSDFISLIAVSSKLGKNPEIMPALANQKLYLVVQTLHRISSVSTRKEVPKFQKKSAG